MALPCSAPPLNLSPTFVQMKLQSAKMSFRESRVIRGQDAPGWGGQLSHLIPKCPAPAHTGEFLTREPKKSRSNIHVIFLRKIEKFSIYQQVLRAAELMRCEEHEGESGIGRGAFNRIIFHSVVFNSSCCRISAKNTRQEDQSALNLSGSL